MNQESDRRARILFVGESWMTHSIHTKGFDSFTTSEYVEGATRLTDALRARGHDLTYIPGHAIEANFPTDPRELAGYDAIVISDVGANSFLLTRESFVLSRRVPNRLELIAAFVRDGGGLLMVGGYLSFAGIDGRARYGEGPIAGVLPVIVSQHDDRVEMPQGIEPDPCDSTHPVMRGLPPRWPMLLGYNRVVTRPQATVLVAVDDDPLLVVGEAGQGRTAAFTSDLAPHWAPPEFVEWAGYVPLFGQMLDWIGSRQLSVSTAGALSLDR